MNGKLKLLFIKAAPGIIPGEIDQNRSKNRKVYY